MKTSKKIILGAVILLAGFYTVMYFNGSFNEVVILEKKNSEHTIYGEMLEGSFDKKEDAEFFSAFQKKLIEENGESEISSFYLVNPTKENHSNFKVFMGIEEKYKKNDIEGFKIMSFTVSKVISGKQQCSPGFQKVHGELMNYSEKKELNLSFDSLYESYSSEGVYVEMKIN